jgi:putative zinc finger/helix-turn-helix YgiT family protein
MSDNLVQFPSGELRTCLECGVDAVRMSFKDEHFVYGAGADAVELTARVPVWTCCECGDAYTDGVAEDLRHEAVCHHLDVLAPREIRAVREKYRMSQVEFAKATAFGLASVKRWETGALIQNPVADRLLRLLANDPAIMNKLVDMSTERVSNRSQVGVFRTQFTAEIRSEAASFVLRRVSM